MKIRHKLTLQFNLIFAAILGSIAFSIYYAYARNREEEYYQQLKKQAFTKASLVLDAKVAPSVLQLIYKNSPNALFQEEIAIYDTGFHLLYHDAVDIDFVKETKQMIDAICRKGEIRFLQDDRQVVGFSLWNKGRQYAITAASYDQEGLSKLRELKYILLITFLSSMVFVLAAGWFFSLQALRPITKILKRVSEIGASNLDLRVEAGDGRDEIAELAVTFNAMLERLEKSFDAQKHFVSNIAHELRTPLSAIIAELDIASAKDRSLEEYQKSIGLALGDARRLARLSNDLLDLAKADYDPSKINFKPVRLDELLLDAKLAVQKIDPAYRVSITYEREFENDDFISVHGNEYLLKVAFSNLMENACKFSRDNRSDVAIHFEGGQTVLRFSDAGPGIAAEDLPHLFKPFYRGANGALAHGNGIGLSLMSKIVRLHRGRIGVTTKENGKTTFTVELAHL